MDLEKRKKTNIKIFKIFGVLFALVILGIIVSDDKEKEKQAAAIDNLTQHEKDSIATEKLIFSAFSQWDGSQKNLVDYVKENMNDPKSFEHVETKMYRPGDSSLVVVMTYRGKNAFGGLVKNVIRAETKLDGTLIKVYTDQ
jgi:hypothetical protein